jgi:hypothetical protein
MVINYKEIYRKKGQKTWAHSSAWIEWLPAEQLVEGSNPSGPASIMNAFLGPTPYITILDDSRVKKTKGTSYQ